MRALKLRLVLGGICLIFALVAQNFVEEHNEQVRHEVMRAEQGSDPALAAAPSPAASPYTVIPPVNGSWDEMWAGLRTLDEVYFPVFNFGRKDGVPMTPDNAVPIWADDMTYEHLYVQYPVEGEMQRWNAVYTDSGLFTETVMMMTNTPRDYLEWALDDDFSAGVSFNPKSRVSDVDVHSYVLNKFGVAELIGYIDAVSAGNEQGPYCAKATSAYEQRAYHEVLYFWGRCYRNPVAGEDWMEAELSKVKAYQHLDFPGSRARAVSELQWFIDNHGETDERAAVLAGFIALDDDPQTAIE